MMTHAIWLGGDKGGVGKDILCEGTCAAALLQGMVPMMIEVETSRRLGLLYPDAKTIILNPPSPATLYDNPDSVFEPLDEACGYWRSAPLSVTTLGANVTSELVAWGRAHGSKALNDGAGVTAAIVLTMNRHAISSGLQNLYDIGKVFPAARRVAILNDVHASFLEGDQFLARRLEEARGNGAAIDTIRIRRCTAPTWGYSQNSGTLQEIASLDPQKLIDLGLPEGPVSRSAAIITTWIADALIAPMTALLPPTERPKKARSK